MIPFLSFITSVEDELHIFPVLVIIVRSLVAEQFLFGVVLGLTGFAVLLFLIIVFSPPLALRAVGNLVDTSPEYSSVIEQQQETQMIQLQKFRVSFTTKAGDQVVEVKAFNRQQAKRKMLSNFSNKFDQPRDIKIEEIA